MKRDEWRVDKELMELLLTFVNGEQMRESDEKQKLQWIVPVS